MNITKFVVIDFMKNLLKIFPFLFISTLFINACAAQELSLREQADNYCNAHNSESLTTQEKKQATKHGLQQIIDMRVSKAAQQPEFNNMLKKVLSVSTDHTDFFHRLNKAVSDGVGEKWLCPYLTYTFESDSLASDLRNKTDAKLLPISIGSLEPYSKHEANELIISIDEENEIYADELKLASTDIENIINAIKKMGASKNTRIIINADAKSSWQIMLNVIFAIKEAGIDKVYFVTQ